MIKKTFANNVYNSLLVLAYLRKSSRIFYLVCICEFSRLINASKSYTNTLAVITSNAKINDNDYSETQIISFNL